MNAAVLVVHLGSYLSLCVYSLSDSRTSLDDASIKAKGDTLGLFQRRVGSRCLIMNGDVCVLDLVFCYRLSSDGFCSDLT